MFWVALFKNVFGDGSIYTGKIGIYMEV